MEAARSAASFLDGCGEAGEAQGILDGSNFVATSLQLRSDFVATSSHLACNEQPRHISSKLILVLQNGNLCFLTHDGDLGAKMGGNDSYGRCASFYI